MADLRKALPKTWGSPTMSPHCDDEKKYGIVDAVTKHFDDAKAKGDKVAGQAIRDLVTVNGVRVTRRGRHLGPGARVVEQAGAGRRGGKPGLGAAHARHVQGGRRRAAHASGCRRVQSDDLSVLTSPRLRGEVDIRATARMSGEGALPQSLSASATPPHPARISLCSMLATLSPQAGRGEEAYPQYRPVPPTITTISPIGRLTAMICRMRLSCAPAVGQSLASTARLNFSHGPWNSQA